MTDAIDGIRAELAELSDQGLLRRMRAIDGAQGPEITVDGRRVANFSSNNYLGLATHPALIEAVRESLAADGFGSAGSRLVSGSVLAHRQLELRLAEWLGVERALLFNSGYQANVGLVSALARPGDDVFSDALNHASLIDGCRLSRAQVRVYPHNDVAALAVLVAGSAAPRKLVLTESIFSMDGDRPELDRLAAVCRAKGALLVVDDAHAVGALGPGGTGLAAGVADLVVGTFGKSFGGFGAYVAGRAPLIELISQRARSFVFSTALPALVSAANAAALEFIAGPLGEVRRASLDARRIQLGRGLESLGLGRTSGSHIQPVFIRGGDPAAAMRVSDELLQRGLFVQGIRPPTVPRGTSRLRVALMATHTEQHVTQLLDALHELSPWLGRDDSGHLT